MLHRGSPRSFEPVPTQEARRSEAPQRSDIENLTRREVRESQGSRRSDKWRDPRTSPRPIESSNERQPT